MKYFHKIEVGIATYLSILRRQIAKLSGRRLARFIQKLRERSLSMVWRYSVAAIRDGKVIARRSGIGLNTQNFGFFLTSVLSSPPANGSTSAPMVATDGTNNNIIFWGATTSGLFFNTAYSGVSFVQLGTGTTPATRADYALQTPIPGTANFFFSWEPGTANTAYFTTAISYSTAQTPSELGLFVVGNTGSAAKTFMIDHAVFSALPAAALFDITYSVSLS